MTSKSSHLNDCSCLECRAARAAAKSARRIRKSERLNRTMTEMLERNLSRGTGCKSIARAIERRLRRAGAEE